MVFKRIWRISTIKPLEAILYKDTRQPVCRVSELQLFSISIYHKVASSRLVYYSKALRYTFWGERKKSCSSKFVQLLLLNKVKARWSKNCTAQGFHYINSFISIVFGLNLKMCSFRPCILRPYCMGKSEFKWFIHLNLTF